MFELGETVIDVHKRTVVTIIGKFPDADAIENLYAVKTDYGKYYITGDSNLMKYDKSYFDIDA